LPNISIVAISVGLPKAATNAVIVGTPVMIANFLLTVLLERHFRIFSNWWTLSIFVPRNSGRGGVTSGL